MASRWFEVPILVALLALAGCATAGGRSAAPDARVQVGLASYYGGAHHGRTTASGERFDERAMTAAHRTLPFGTRVRVTHLDNHRSVVLKITDRGPFRRDRIIDVSRRASEELGFRREGIARVRVEVL